MTSINVDTLNEAQAEAASGCAGVGLPAAATAAVVAAPPPSTPNGATAVNTPVVGRLGYVFDPCSSRQGLGSLVEIEI